MPGVVMSADMLLLQSALMLVIAAPLEAPLYRRLLGLEVSCKARLLLVPG